MENLQQPTPTINVKEATVCILKTILLFEKGYGADYLVRVVQGYDKYGMRKESHKELETFGSLEGLYSEHLVNIIYFLIREGYLDVTKPAYGVIGITSRGKTFLETPTDLAIPKDQMETNSVDRLMTDALRYLRKTFSEKDSVEIYQVYSNYAIRCMVEKKPGNNAQLETIPGINSTKLARYGADILGEISRVQERPGEVIREHIMLRAKQQGHQKAKASFLEEKTIEEIATICELKTRTVRRYLITLHKAGEIDLFPWIEKNLGKEDLQKGASYFQREKNVRLKAANQALGLDYETLRLCRLYARKSA